MASDEWLVTVKFILLDEGNCAKAKPVIKLHVNAPQLTGSPLLWRGVGGEAERMASGE